MSHTSKLSSSGFTLVELLIVVAIIGVLATIGVPTYKKMVAKAHQSEAKLMLGSVYTIESAFFSEWGSYGNRLPKMGLDATGNDPYYLVGTNQSGCQKPSGDIPSLVSSYGIALSQTAPDYYLPAYASTGLTDFFYGRLTLTVCDPSVYFVSMTGTYLIPAQGVIKSAVPRDTPPSAASLDIWTIDQDRNLANTQSGL